MSFLYAVGSYHCDKIHFFRCYTFKKQGCNIEHIKKNNTPAMCIPPPPSPAWKAGYENRWGSGHLWRVRKIRSSKIKLKSEFSTEI